MNERMVSDATVRELSRIVRPDDLVVEVGVWRGGLSRELCLMGAQVVGVDNLSFTFEQGEVSEQGAPTAEGIIAYVDDPRFELIVADSSTVGREWDRGPVDVLVIDGDHSFEGCRADVLAWLPHLRVGGWLVMDDVGGWWGVDQNLFPGVRKVAEAVFSFREMWLEVMADSWVAFFRKREEVWMDALALELGL